MEELLSYLPLILLLICPISMIFMHRGHNHSHGHSGKCQNSDQENEIQNLREQHEGLKAELNSLKKNLKEGK